MTLVWQDGRIVGPTEAHISVADRGFLLGDGLFETMPVHRHRVFDLNAHLERLASGLALLNLAEAVDLAKLRAGIGDYLEAEDLETAIIAAAQSEASGRSVARIGRGGVVILEGEKLRDTIAKRADDIARSR